MGIGIRVYFLGLRVMVLWCVLGRLVAAFFVGRVLDNNYRLNMVICFKFYCFAPVFVSVFLISFFEIFIFYG